MDSQRGEDEFAAARRRMVTRDLKGRDITDADVLRVMGQVRREEFVLETYQSQAYADSPLSIGIGQTISQPYIVALMTQQLRLAPGCTVLEIGTGSGYQTAVLSKLARKVYTIERFSQLSESAQAVLGRLEVDNVQFYIGDGSCGWPGQQSFDRIIITAAVPAIPQPLIEQLVEGGLMVVPIGSGWVQQLVVCEKIKDKIVERSICDVRFVKLIGQYTFEQ
jgi:protein-L-isoaspartate(D-aspartate) O-methyltransferase